MLFYMIAITLWIRHYCHCFKIYSISIFHIIHDDVIKWKRFPRYWPFVWGIHQSPVNSPHKGQWRGALMFLIYAWTNGWVNNRDAGNLRHHRGYYDVTVTFSSFYSWRCGLDVYICSLCLLPSHICHSSYYHTWRWVAEMTSYCSTHRK